MRRIASSILMGLGAFLVMAALLMRFYAYPALATVPTNYESTTTLQAPDAEVFNSDPSVLAPETTDLTVTAYTVADSGADAPDDVAVWVTNTTIARSDGSIFQQSVDRVAFDKVSGAAVDCDTCDTFSETVDGERTPTTPEGQLVKFPFDTQKKDYPVWDSTVGEPVTAVYGGESTIEGTKVYEFTQTISDTVVDTREVPGSVFGSDEASVDADVVYAVTRTYYINPVTGSPVNRVDVRNQRLVADGVEVPAFVGTLQYSPDSVSDAVDAAADASLLGGFRVLYPVVAAVLGVLLFAAGLLLRRGGRDQSTPRKKKKHDRELVSA